MAGPSDGVTPAVLIRLVLTVPLFPARLRQLRERALDGRDHAGGHARVTCRRLKFVVSEQSLDNSNVGTAFEQVRREAVAQRMQGQPWLADTGGFDGLSKQTAELAWRDRLVAAMTGENPTLCRRHPGVVPRRALAPPLSQ